MSTKTKPSIDTIAAAVHSIPAPPQAPEYAAPPIGILPESLHELHADLSDAHRVLAEAEAARARAVAATRAAKEKYRNDLFAAVRDGTNVGEVVNTEAAANDAYSHIREVKKAAEARCREAHFVLTQAVVEHRDEITELVNQVLVADQADEAEALRQLADARHRLSASRGVMRWLADAEPGKNLKRPFRA